VAAVGTGAVSKVTSDSSGLFTINNLTADLYKIEVVADGFTPIHGDVAVNADTTTSVNATLHAGPGPAPVSSVGTGPLQLDRNDVSTLFDSQAIADLPMFDRNLTRLELLVPGAARAKLAISPNQNPQGSQPVNINGQYFSGSAFQLDGTENRDPLEGIVIINPPPDAVLEMKVTTQGYNAEFGQATAGVVTVQTRSGTNNWHGDGYGYRRTGFGQTDDPFEVGGVPPQKNSIFGGSLGGPIVRNKLFIFGDYEGTRSSAGANVLLNVPSKQFRNTCLMGEDCDLSAYSEFIDGPLHNDDSNMTPFPNYTIPSSDVSPQAVALLKLLPPPNNKPVDPVCASQDPNLEPVCNNFLVSGAEILNGDQFDVRADYNLKSSFRLFGRYSFGDFRDIGSPAFGTVAGGTGSNPAGFAGNTRTRLQGIGVGFTYTLSPRTVTDFRFGFFRYRLNNDSQDFGTIPNLNPVIPGIFSTKDPFASGMPDIQIPGQSSGEKPLVSSIGSDYLRFGYSPTTNNCNCPLREREQQFQFVNNWTRTAGRHLVKWGADLRYLQNYRLASTDRRTGFFNFAPNPTGLGLATLLLGDVSTFERVVSTPVANDAGERQKRFGFYGQDTWRVNSRLTLNYGLRWELYFPQTVNVAGGFLLPTFDNPDPGKTFFNVAGDGSAGGVSNSWKNVAPRVGLAYLLNSTTVIRAGYGRSFDAGFAGSIFGIAPTQNPPVTADQQIESGGFNLADGPPAFVIPQGARFSLLDLAGKNIGAPSPGPNIPAIPPSGAILYGLPSRVRVPTVDSWNLTVQHELTSHMYLELAYLGNKGTDVFTDSNNNVTYYNLNQPSLQGIILRVHPPNDPNISMCKNQKFFFTDGTNSFCLKAAQFRSFYTPNQINPPDCKKPKNPCFFDPTLFPVQYFGNNASDNYNALQARVQKTFSRGYSFMAHYTWAKGLDYDSNYFRVDPRVGYGPATFDVMHRFVLTNIWELPFGRGKTWFGGIGTTADRFIGGWTLSATTIWRSGLPFTPSYSSCAQDVDGSSPCRPNAVDLVNILGDREEYFATTGGMQLQGAHCIQNAMGKTFACGVDPTTGDPVPGQRVGPWQRPGAGQIGNVGRNSFRGPGFFQSDVTLAKIVSITERANLRFRVDAFNVFNKVNLGQPNVCVDCPNGGVISGLGQGAIMRTLQFALRVEF